MAAPRVAGVAASLRTVQHVAHPEFAGVAEREAAAVLGGVRLGRTLEQSGALEQAVDGGRGQVRAGRQLPVGLRLADDLAHGPFRVALLERGQ